MQKKKIVFASQEEIKLLRPYVMRVLEAIGHPEAWVSDKSCVGDFGCDEEECAEIAQRLGLESVTGRDYLIALANKLKERE